MGKYVDLYKQYSGNGREMSDDRISEVESMMNMYESDYGEDICKKAIFLHRSIPFGKLFDRDFFGMAVNSLKYQKEADELRQKDNTGNAMAAINLLNDSLVNAIEKDEDGRINKILHDKVFDMYKVEHRKIVYVAPDNHVIDEVVHEKFSDICYHAMNNLPFMLVGPAGTGKSYTVRQIAKHLGYEYYSTGAVYQPYELTGFMSAENKYWKTQFYKACEAGANGRKAIFCLDEIDASSKEALTKFNDAIANGRFEFPCGVLEFKGNVEFAACANTWGLGASSEYVGRTQQDAAVLDRFAKIPFGYSPAIEASLTDDSELLDFIRDFRSACELAGIKHVVSYRGIERLDAMVRIPNMDLPTIIQEDLTMNMQKDDINMVVSRMKVDNKYTEALKKVEVK